MPVIGSQQNIQLLQAAAVDAAAARKWKVLEVHQNYALSTTAQRDTAAYTTLVHDFKIWLLASKEVTKRVVFLYQTTVVTAAQIRPHTG